MTFCRWSRINQQKRAARASLIIPEIKLSDNPAFPGNTDVYEIPDGYDLLLRWIIDGMVYCLDAPYMTAVSFSIQYWNDPVLYTDTGMQFASWFSGKHSMRPTEYIDEKAYAMYRPAKKATMLISGVVVGVNHYKKRELAGRKISYARTAD